MNKFLITFFTLFLMIQPSYSFGFNNLSQDHDIRAIRRLLNSQVNYANKTNFKKFIATYDESYLNADGFDYNIYGNLIKDVWNSYNKIKYGILIKDIKIDGENATVELTETSSAKLYSPENLEGELNSSSESIYYLKKFNGKWKVISDKVLQEDTSMLYGDAKGLDIALSVSDKITPNSEYTATLQFIPPEGTMAIASITSEKVEYPQKQAKEVFRTLPEDNILERLFTANNENADEYVVASIGLTKSEICDLSIKLSLTGYGYKIIRVNVLRNNAKINEGINDKDK